jgi:peptidoglycan lytic transglycosylase A
MCFTGTTASAGGPLKFADSQLEPIKWSELAGWRADDHLAAFVAYQASCRALRKQRTDDPGQMSGALSNVCRKAADLQPKDADTARAFFEQNFEPVRIARLGEVAGLLTGYFEPVVAGSRFPSPEFPVPLYRRPRDLVADGYKPGSVAFPNKGVRIGRRNEKNELVPYYDRGAIEAGALDGQKLEICWLKDPLDLLTLQLEGSGRVMLEDGTPLRVSFDSHNGYRFSSIERVLIDRNLIPRNEISTQRIRDWMAAHPDEAAKVRAANRSYVFFRVTGLSNEGEPVGAQGVPLTPGRSLAVDRLHAYGTPFFIEADLPIERGKASPFRRLMIAQDTGSAMVGPARADLYWGAGDNAGRIAARIRHPGRFVMLLPRELDIVATGSGMPLPAPRPKIATIEVAKRDGKGNTVSAGAVTEGRRMPSPTPTPTPKIAALEAGKRDGQGKTNSAQAGAIATTGHSQGKANSTPAGAIATTQHNKPSPTPTPKIAAREAGKQDGKGKANSTQAGAITATRHNKPSPTPTPKIAAREAGKRDGQGKANSAQAGAIAANRPILLPVLKPKNSATAVKKQDGKGNAESAGAAPGASAHGRQKQLPATTPKIAATEGGKPDAKGKKESAGIGASAAGRKEKPSLVQKSKAPGIEVKKQIEVRKQNGKGKADAASGDGKAAAWSGR